MQDRKGFTLMEIIATLVILMIVVRFMLPNFTHSAEQTRAQAAKNNLLAIAAAQSRFNEDYSTNCANALPVISPCYCLNSGTNPNTVLGGTCGDSAAKLNSNLRLDISSSDHFSYSCTTNAAPYQCTATDGSSVGNLTLTLNVNAATMAVSVSCCTWAAGPVCNAGGPTCPS